MQGNKQGSTAVSKRPAGGSSAPTSSGSRTTNKTGGAVKRYTGSSGGGGSVNQGGIWRYYTDDAAGLKISPSTVLAVSLTFICFVISLHIFGKLRK
mmetsp:Transcript_58040/g.118773  ORF Transcript_58040/g.118773 Transcript_58040/m.118773 type:complete len:96 (-) Transcript_58040:122-409(-)